MKKPKIPNRIEIANDGRSYPAGQGRILAGGRKKD